MNKLLLTAFAFTTLGAFAQNVNIPDANFKAYLVNEPTINTSGDSEIQVSEAAAFTGQIDCSHQSISDLTGIEAFTALTHLNCYNNQLTSIDVSHNTALTYLSCSVNQLTSLDVSQNTLLETLGCGSNQLSSLDVSNNTSLIGLHFYQNNIGVMDISNNGSLTELNGLQNALVSLNAANGNNTNFITFNTTGNPNLTCIQVDDASYSTTNWTNVDTTVSFTENCSSAGVNELFKLDVSVYPNPTEGRINFITSESINTITIFNLTGQNVSVFKNENVIDISRLPSGIYTATIQTKSGKTAFKKLVKE